MTICFLFAKTETKQADKNATDGIVNDKKRNGNCTKELGKIFHQNALNELAR